MAGFCLNCAKALFFRPRCWCSTQTKCCEAAPRLWHHHLGWEDSGTGFPCLCPSQHSSQYTQPHSSPTLCPPKAPSVRPQACHARQPPCPGSSASQHRFSCAYSMQTIFESLSHPISPQVMAMPAVARSLAMLVAPQHVWAWGPLWVSSSPSHKLQLALRWRGRKEVALHGQISSWTARAPCCPSCGIVLNFFREDIIFYPQTHKGNICIYVFTGQEAVCFGWLCV